MSPDELEQRAAIWLAREDRGLNSQEQAGLQAWLEESSLNRVTYLRLKAVWRQADRLAALRGPNRSPIPVRDTAPLLSRWRVMAAILLLLALAGAGMLYLRPAPPSVHVYATAVGDTRQVRLADGSLIELNTDSRIHTRMTDASRIVTLDAGEIYFDVVHNGNRPFVVYAGNRRITDLGTRFSVYRDGNDVRVTVQEGRVRIDALGDAQPGAPVVVVGGQEAISHGDETLLVPKSSQEIDNSLSWRDDMLVFNQQPLAEVAEQFNRYNRQRIIVEGQARKIRIGGSFKTNNVAGFASLLHQGFGLTIQKRGGDIIVSH